MAKANFLKDMQSTRAPLGACQGSKKVAYQTISDKPESGRMECPFCGKEVKVTIYGRFYTHKAGPSSSTT